MLSKMNNYYFIMMILKKMTYLNFQ